MAEDANANIRIDIDTSEATAALKALQGQIARFHTEMARGGVAAGQAASNLQNKLVNSINAGGQFQASMVKVQSTTEAFTTALEKNKLSMGQYFRYAGAATKTFGKFFGSEFQTITKVATERVKDLQTQYISMGRDANGALQSIKVRPLTLDMKSLTTQTMLATQKQQLYNQLLKQGSTNLLNFGKNTQWAGRQLMVGFTIPLTMFAAAASKSFMDIEKQIIKIRRVYGDFSTTVQQTDEMIKSIRTLASEYTKYGVAVKDTIGLASDAAAAGKTGQELLAQVSEATRLAVLGNVSQTQALETTMSVTNAFGVATQDLANKIDFLNAVENQSVTSIEDLTIAIPKAGPVVQQLGGDVEDLAFFLTAMKEGGINASEGANALKSGLAALINPTGKAKEMLQGFGINIEKIVNSNKGDVKGLVLDFSEALDTLDPLNRARAIEQLFGKFQFSRLSTLFQNVIGEGTQAARVLELTKATTQELAILSQRELKRVEDTTTYKFEKAFADFQNALAPVGEEFLKVVTPIIEFGTKLLQQFNSMGDGAKAFTVILTTVVAGIGPALLMTVGLVANGVANLIKMFSVIGNLFNKTGGDAANLGLSTEYMTQQQIEAAAVAASLGQSHSRLTQIFSVEAAALNSLTLAYQKAITAQQGFGIGGGKVPGSATKPKKYATGGVVRGPGTGTSDSIPAMLSNGEAVIPAKQAKKYSGFISQMISGNVPGFFGGVMLPQKLGKTIKTRKEYEAPAEEANAGYLQSSLAGREPEQYLRQHSGSGGHSFEPFGVGGAYIKPDGTPVMVKPVQNEQLARAEIFGTRIAREAHGLQAPEQRLVVIQDPTDLTGQRRFLALESAYDQTFVAPEQQSFTKGQFFKQLVASLVRNDKDLQSANLWGNVIADVGPAGVFAKASGVRSLTADLPSMQQQAMINLLGVKGGARKDFALSTADIARGLSPADYARGITREIDEVLPRLRSTINSFDLNPQEKIAYQAMIARLEAGRNTDWTQMQSVHAAAMPTAPKAQGFARGGFVGKKPPITTTDKKPTPGSRIPAEAYDFDDTLIDFGQYLTTSREANKKLPWKDRVKWWSDEELRGAINVAHPMPRVIEQLKKSQQAGKQIIVLTARPSSADGITREHLAALGIDPTNIKIVSRNRLDPEMAALKAPELKNKLASQLINDYDIEAFYDDLLENRKALSVLGIKTFDPLKMAKGGIVPKNIPGFAEGGIIQNSLSNYLGNVTTFKDKRPSIFGKLNPIQMMRYLLAKSSDKKMSQGGYRVINAMNQKKNETRQQALDRYHAYTQGKMSEQILNQANQKLGIASFPGKGRGIYGASNLEMPEELQYSHMFKPGGPFAYIPKEKNTSAFFGDLLGLLYHSTGSTQNEKMQIEKLKNLSKPFLNDPSKTPPGLKAAIVEFFSIHRSDSPITKTLAMNAKGPNRGLSFMPDKEGPGTYLSSILKLSDQELSGFAGDSLHRLSMSDEALQSVINSRGHINDDMLAQELFSYFKGKKGAFTQKINSVDDVKKGMTNFFETTGSTIMSKFGPDDPFIKHLQKLGYVGYDRGPIVHTSFMAGQPGFDLTPFTPTSGPIGYKNGVVSVPGPKGAGDVVPAMLSPGEAVIPTKMAKKYGGLISGMIADNIPGYRKGYQESHMGGDLDITDPKIIDQIEARYPGFKALTPEQQSLVAAKGNLTATLPNWMNQAMRESSSGIDPDDFENEWNKYKGKLGKAAAVSGVDVSTEAGRIIVQGFEDGIGKEAANLARLEGTPVFDRHLDAAAESILTRAETSTNSAVADAAKKLKAQRSVVGTIRSNLPKLPGETDDAALKRLYNEGKLTAREKGMYLGDTDLQVGRDALPGSSSKNATPQQKALRQQAELARAQHYAAGGDPNTKPVTMRGASISSGSMSVGRAIRSYESVSDVEVDSSGMPFQVLEENKVQNNKTGAEIASQSAKDVADGAAEQAQTNSPSKVTKKIGKDTAQGYIDGVQSGVAKARQAGRTSGRRVTMDTGGPIIVHESGTQAVPTATRKGPRRATRAQPPTVYEIQEREAERQRIIRERAQAAFGTKEQRKNFGFKTPMQKIGGKIAAGAQSFARGPGMMAASMAGMPLMMIPGLEMMGMAVSVLGPMLMMLPGPIMGVVAALAGMVGIVMALNAAQEEQRRKAVELANAQTMSINSVNQMAEEFGTVGVTQLRQSKEDAKASGVSQRRLSEGEQYLTNAQTGQALLASVKTQQEAGLSSSDIAENVASNIATAVSQNVITQKQGESIIAALGRLSGDTRIASTGIAQFNTLTENIEKTAGMVATQDLQSLRAANAENVIIGAVGSDMEGNIIERVVGGGSPELATQGMNAYGRAAAGIDAINAQYSTQIEEATTKKQIAKLEQQRSTELVNQKQLIKDIYNETVKQQQALGGAKFDDAFVADIEAQFGKESPMAQTAREIKDLPNTKFKLNLQMGFAGGNISAEQAQYLLTRAQQNKGFAINYEIQVAYAISGEEQAKVNRLREAAGLKPVTLGADKPPKKKKEDPVEDTGSSGGGGSEAVDPLQKKLDKRNAALRIIGLTEAKINKKYDDRKKALEEIAKINSQISQQQRDQLDIADALSRGDIAAAARAAQQYRTNSMQRAQEAQAKALEDAQKKELEGVTFKGKTRSSLETILAKLEMTLAKREYRKLAGGGMAKNYSVGGKVMSYFADGGSPLGSDTVPAMLTPGEFVVKRPAVKNFGVKKLESINNGSYGGNSVYNYSINVNAGTDASPEQIARAVSQNIKRTESYRLRGNKI